MSVYVGLNVGLNSSYKTSRTEQEVIDLLLSNSNFTALVIAEKLGLTNRTIERALNNLQSHDIIERIGSKKTGRWKVIK